MQNNTQSFLRALHTCESKALSQNARMALQLIPTLGAKRAGKFVWPN
jgi:hypothetical protein